MQIVCRMIEMEKFFSWVVSQDTLGVEERIVENCPESQFGAVAKVHIKLFWGKNLIQKLVDYQTYDVCGKSVFSRQCAMHIVLVE